MNTIANAVGMIAASAGADALANALGVAVGTMMTILMVTGVIAIVLYILYIVASWKLFAKAGEAGWKSLIPFLNGHVLYRIAWKPAWFWIGVLLDIALLVLSYFNPDSENMILLAISGALGLITIIIHITFSVKLSKAFGHGGGYALGLIFFPSIFWLILAYGESEYVRKVR